MAGRSGPLFAGVDLGGTNIRACIAGGDGALRAHVRIPTQASAGPRVVVARIIESVRKVADEAGVRLSELGGVGVGAPGPLDMASGIVLYSPNLPGWQDVPVTEWLGEELGIPAKIGNDANLAAVGEHSYGAGRGIEDMVYLTVSTGIGGGAIIAGKLLVGTSGIAAELGHMTIDWRGPRCNCGNVGCLEAIAAGPAIARAGQAAARQAPESGLMALAGGDAEQVTTALVVRAAQAGDETAQAVFANAAEAIGVGCVNIIHCFNPRRIIIGGGVSQAGDLLFGPVRQVIASRALSRDRQNCDVVPAGLGDDAGLYGALALVAHGIEALV